MNSRQSQIAVSAQISDNFTQAIAQDQKTIVDALAFPNYHEEVSTVAEHLYQNIDCYDTAAMNVSLTGLFASVLGLAPSLIASQTYPLLAFGTWSGFSITMGVLGTFGVQKGLFSRRFAKHRWKSPRQYTLQEEFSVQDNGTVTCTVFAGEPYYLTEVCSMEIGRTCNEEIAARTLAIQALIASLKKENELQFQEALQTHGITARGHIADAKDPRIVKAWRTKAVDKPKELLPAAEKEEQKMLQSTNQHLLAALKE